MIELQYECENTYKIGFLGYKKLVLMFKNTKFCVVHYQMHINYTGNIYNCIYYICNLWYNAVLLIVTPSLSL